MHEDEICLETYRFKKNSKFYKQEGLLRYIPGHAAGP